MAVKSLKVVADLETTTTPDDVRAWAVCAVDIDTSETVFMANNLTDFMEWLKDKNDYSELADDILYDADIEPAE